MKNLLLRVAILLPLASLGMSVFAETLTDRLSLSNDFRFRQEHIDTTNDTSLPNNRQRFRARLGLDYKVNDKVTGGLHLASGSTDPVSTNQSLEGGFTTKSIGIDRAYVQWSPLDNFEILAGKQKNPFYTIHDSELIWDGDLRPEGISTSYSCGCGDWTFSANLAQFVVEEGQSPDNDDVSLFGSQLMVEGKVEALVLTLGASYFGYNHIIGRPTIYETTKSFGNSTSGSNYATGFLLTELFGSVGTTIGNTPVHLFYDRVENDAAPINNSAWLAGIKIGKAKDAGSWAFRYNWREVEADAVLGAFTDSDFKGGGTDGEGSEYGFDYQVDEKIQLGFTFFANKTSLTNIAAPNYHRAQLDFIFSL